MVKRKARVRPVQENLIIFKETVGSPPVNIPVDNIRSVSHIDLTKTFEDDDEDQSEIESISIVTITDLSDETDFDSAETEFKSISEKSNNVGIPEDAQSEYFDIPPNIQIVFQDNKKESEECPSDSSIIPCIYPEQTSLTDETNTEQTEYLVEPTDLLVPEQILLMSKPQ